MGELLTTVKNRQKAASIKIKNRSFHYFSSTSGILYYYYNYFILLLLQKSQKANTQAGSLVHGFGSSSGVVTMQRVRLLNII